RDVLRCVIAGGDGDKLADRALVRRLRKMHGDVPAPVGTPERGDRGLALEKTLGQQINHAPRALLVADREAGTVGAGGSGGSHYRSRESTQADPVLINYPVIGWAQHTCLPTVSQHTVRSSGHDVFRQFHSIAALCGDGLRPEL